MIVQHSRNREGFSLVEIIVAIMILSFGLLAMAASTGYVSAQLRSSGFDTKRNLARQQVVEQLRGTFFAAITTNSTGLTFTPYTVTWVVTSPTTAVKQVSIITRGPAYRARQGSQVTITDTALIEIMSPK